MDEKLFYLNTQYNWEQIEGLMADLILSQKETERRFQETERRFQETERRFQETERRFQETDRIIKESSQETDRIIKESSQETERIIKESTQVTDRKFQETARLVKELRDESKHLSGEVKGMGKSNGEYAEDFFYTALEKAMQVGKYKFDYISRNMHLKRKKLEGEYDIILYNDYKVLIVEVKYRFRMDYLRDFYEEKLKIFRALFPQYSNYKIYGAVAAFAFEKDVKKEAEKYGFYIFTQSNEKFKIANAKDFEPNEIK